MSKKKKVEKSDIVDIDDLDVVSCDDHGDDGVSMTFRRRDGSSVTLEWGAIIAGGEALKGIEEMRKAGVTGTVSKQFGELLENAIREHAETCPNCGPQYRAWKKERAQA